MFNGIDRLVYGISWGNFGFGWLVDRFGFFKVVGNGIVRKFEIKFLVLKDNKFKFV